MRNWIRESLRTFAVTTYHPVGWGLERMHASLLGPGRVSEERAKDEHVAPVILVHGVFHNASAFYRFESVLKREGFRNASTLELWTSVHSVERMADQLKKTVRQALEKAGPANRLGKARIVAHSLGGMVARVALLDPDFAALLDKVIFLGVPHQGHLLFEMPFLPCNRDLSEGAPLLTRLRAEPLPGPIRYWNFRGGLDLVTGGPSTFLPHVPNLVFEGVGHAGLLRDRNVIRTALRILEAPESRFRSES